MKNRKLIILFFAMAIVIVGIKMKLQKEEVLLPDPVKEVPSIQNDLKKIESHLKPQNIQTPNWEIVVDYRTDLKKTINKENARSFFETATKNLPDLVDCLRKDYCGMDPATIESPYFDSERTPAHLLLARTLNVLLESLKNHPELAAQVDWNLIREIAGLSGDEIQDPSMELLLNFDPKNNGKANLLAIAESYKGPAKANFYSQMAENLQPEERSLFVGTIEKTFERDDPHTVISVVEKMKTYHLKKEETQGLSKALCRFKGVENQDHNWQMLVHEMKKNGGVDLEQVCP